MLSEASMDPVKVDLESLDGLHYGELENPDADGFAFDLGNLCASDSRPIPADHIQDSGLPGLAAAREAAQALIARLFSLPGEADSHGHWIVQLPDPVTAVPREKPMPTQRPLTRWERFAKRKGIKKKKKEKLVWDEENNTWRRRFGYKRAGDANDVVVVAAKPTDEVGDDPFTKMDSEKKQRVMRQNRRELANVKAAAKAGYKTPTAKLSASLPDRGKGHPLDRKHLLGEVKSAVVHAGVSTASMGKFDRPLKGEMEDEKKRPVKRRKPIAAGESTATEIDTLAKMADKLVREKSDEVLEIGRAIGQMEAAKREKRHKEKVNEFLKSKDGRDKTKSKKGRGPKRGGKRQGVGKKRIRQGGKGKIRKR